MCSSSASTVSTVITVSTSTPGISPRIHGPGRGFGPHCGPTLLPTKMSPSPSFAAGLVMPVGQWHVNGTPSLAPGPSAGGSAPPPPPAPGQSQPTPPWCQTQRGTSTQGRTSVWLRHH
jgi:hypothetical protein